MGQIRFGPQPPENENGLGAGAPPRPLQIHRTMPMLMIEVAIPDVDR